MIKINLKVSTLEKKKKDDKKKKKGTEWGNGKPISKPPKK